MYSIQAGQYYIVTYKSSAEHESILRHCDYVVRSSFAARQLELHVLFFFHYILSFVTTTHSELQTMHKQRLKLAESYVWQHSSASILLLVLQVQGCTFHSVLFFTIGSKSWDGWVRKGRMCLELRFRNKANDFQIYGRANAVDIHNQYHWLLTMQTELDGLLWHLRGHYQCFVSDIEKSLPDLGQFRIVGYSSGQVIFSRTHQQPEVGITNILPEYPDHWFTLIPGTGSKEDLYAIKSMHTGKVLYSRRGREPRVSVVMVSMMSKWADVLCHIPTDDPQCPSEQLVQAGTRIWRIRQILPAHHALG